MVKTVAELGTPEVWLPSEVRAVMLRAMPLNCGVCNNSKWLVSELCGNVAIDIKISKLKST